MYFCEELKLETLSLCKALFFLINSRLTLFTEFQFQENLDYSSSLQKGADVNCQYSRQFNEFLHLPLCSPNKEQDHIYEISVRVTVLTYKGLELKGDWTTPVSTAFICLRPQGTLNY